VTAEGMIEALRNDKKRLSPSEKEKRRSHMESSSEDKGKKGV